MTQLAQRAESFGAGDQSWLGSSHGVDSAKSVTLKVSEWTSKIADKRIKSGEPFKVADGLAVPFGGSGKLAGFILTDQSVDAEGGNVTAPAVWHGRIILSKLPSTVSADVDTTGLFTLEA